jgi:hypothetical protein
MGTAAPRPTALRAVKVPHIQIPASELQIPAHQPQVPLHLPGVMLVEKRNYHPKQLGQGGQMDIKLGWVFHHLKE